MDPHCKIALGWVTPSILSGYSSTPRTLLPSYNNFDAYYKLEEDYPSGEYLLIEYRKKICFDAQLPQVSSALVLLVGIYPKMPTYILCYIYIYVVCCCFD